MVVTCCGGFGGSGVELVSHDDGILLALSENRLAFSYFLTGLPLTNTFTVMSWCSGPIS